MSTRIMGRSLPKPCSVTGERPTAPRKSSRCDLRTGDIVTPEKRSAMMRAVGQRGTSAERAVGAVLRELGVRYRLNHPGLPGRPDFANRSRGWALFVHGCFWHGHRNCRKTKGGRAGRVPNTNRSYWAEKIEANRERDRRKSRELADLGLRVLVLWECELRDPGQVRRKLEEFAATALPVGRISS